MRVLYTKQPGINKVKCRYCGAIKVLSDVRLCKNKLYFKCKKCMDKHKGSYFRIKYGKLGPVISKFQDLKKTRNDI